LPSFARREGTGPVVVAIEGPNGVGKTTLVQSLCQSLGAPGCLGIDEAWSAEPFKVRMIRDADWPASAMFFLSGCGEQMRLVRSRPEPLVIMDRSVWSTLAVQAALEPRRLTVLVAMLGPVAAWVRVPDLTLVLEASLATCQARSAGKRGLARALDGLNATEGYHTREREFYWWLGRQTAGVGFVQVDRLTVAEVARRATAWVRRQL